MSNGYTKTQPDPAVTPDALGPSWSGRRFVIVGVIVLIAIWSALYLVFREWRSRHRELAAFGAREVGPLVDPLASLSPPGVEPKVWADAVRDSHAMLDALTASGLLDRPSMEALRDDLHRRFAATTSESAVPDLTALWDEMQAKAGPILTGRPSRPPFCPTRPEILGKPSTKPPQPVDS